MDPLGSTMQPRFVEKQSEFITDFLMKDSTLRDELQEKVSILQVEIKDQGDQTTKL